MAGRPTSRRGALHRDDVVAAAIALADDGGLGAVSMRSVAGRLGVEAMSLYHHVANKEDMLDGMVDVVFGQLHLPVVGGDWRAEMRARSQSGREVLLRHRWAIGLMDSRRTPGPASLGHHDAVLGCLREAGFSLALTGHAFATLDAHLYGFVLQEASLPFEAGTDAAALAREMLDALPEGHLPYFREFARDRVLQPGYDFGAEFDVGLDLLLEGFAARLAADSGT